MASAEHQFLFAVILMYSFLGMMYFISDGAIAGLPDTSILLSEPTLTVGGNPLIYFIESSVYLISSMLSFFAVLFLTPFVSSEFWWVAPLNWAIFGTTVYIYLGLIRGGK